MRIRQLMREQDQCMYLRGSGMFGAVDVRSSSDLRGEIEDY